MPESNKAVDKRNAIIRRHLIITNLLGLLIMLKVIDSWYHEPGVKQTVFPHRSYKKLRKILESERKKVETLEEAMKVVCNLDDLSKKAIFKAKMYVSDIKI